MQEIESFQRRREARYDVDMEVDILPARKDTSGAVTPCRVKELSRHGIRLSAPSGLLQAGEKRRARFAVGSGVTAMPAVEIVRRVGGTPQRDELAGILRFEEEGDRRKLHGFISSLTGRQTGDRRTGERRILSVTRAPERRVRDRRRRFGIFTDAALFAKRAPSWQAEYTLYRPTEAPQPSRMVVNGRSLISFGSNDYLGLSHDPRVKAAAMDAVERYGTCAGSRVLTGTMELHREFERELARFKGTEAAIVFSGGYLTNVALLTALLKEDDVVYLDEKAHASIIDGCLYSRAKLVPFRHNSGEDLHAKIQRVRAPRALVIVDGVYSLEGDISPLPAIKEVADRHAVPLMVDDAHGLGVMGPTGAGTVEHFGLKGRIDLDMGTLSSALGGVGGFVACKAYVADYLRDFSRGFRFTTSLPPATIAGLVAALKILTTDQGLRTRLWANIEQLKAGLRASGYAISATESSILSIPVGHEQTTWEIVRLLEDRGVYVSPFFRPAVKRGQARIRLTITAAHTPEDIAAAVDVFRAFKPMFDDKTRGAAEA